MRLFSYPSVLTYVLGAQKNCLETVLLSTHNISFGWEIRKIIFCYALLSGGLIHPDMTERLLSGTEASTQTNKSTPVKVTESFMNINGFVDMQDHRTSSAKM